VSKKELPITCPICGRKNLHPLDSLKEGSDLQCPSCKVTLNLHGHRWEEIQQDIAQLNQKD
jgi:DNA-directed RNA polymerase subunit RPC12/RpoP